jgi:hypothetical protein
MHGRQGVNMMLAQRGRMADHVRILAVLNIIFGAIGLFIALIILAIFGGIAGMIGVAAQQPDAQIAMPLLGIIGAAIFVFVLALSLPGIIAGIGLLKFQPWARILTIVLSALNLLNVPIGTALGVYGLWVLLHQDTERLFAAHRTV